MAGTHSEVRPLRSGVDVHQPGENSPGVNKARTLGAPLIVFPIANHDDNQHAKDENIRLQNLWDGTDAFAAKVFAR